LRSRRGCRACGCRSSRSPGRPGRRRRVVRAVYLDQRADVEHYLEVADQLSGEALTPADTIGFIDQVARET
jgi:hypothetical protein